MKESFLLVFAAGAMIGLSVGLSLAPFIFTTQHVALAMWMEVTHRVCTSVGGLGTFLP
jgi:hypothetical protein